MQAQEFLSKVFRFAVVSGIGLALDVLVFAALVAAGARAGWANLVSAGIAVTFVYFRSTRRIFAYRGNFLLELFAVYVAYQIVAVAAASWTVDAIVKLNVHPVLAKLLILPATFGANYFFMGFLTKPRGNQP